MINLLNLFFPKVCEACSNYLSDNEQVICTLCRHELPLTNCHKYHKNDVKKILYGRVDLQNATALLHFSKGGKVQKLLHNLKYKGREQVGKFLGEWLGEELKFIQQYSSIDVVVPVPLHKNKLRTRGFNQVHQFGAAIARELDVEFNARLLQRKFSSNSQVFKSRFSRFNDAKTIFVIEDTETYKNRHILLVDDIITTGATIERCALELLKIKGVKLSLATMAIAE